MAESASYLPVHVDKVNSSNGTLVLKITTLRHYGLAIELWLN